MSVLPKGRKVMHGDKEIIVYPGYTMKHPMLSIQMDHVLYNNTNLSHAIALRILKEKGLWFRMNMTRGWYEADSSYWTP